MFPRICSHPPGPMRTSSNSLTVLQENVDFCDCQTLWVHFGIGTVPSQNGNSRTSGRQVGSEKLNCCVWASATQRLSRFTRASSFSFQSGISRYVDSPNFFEAHATEIPSGIQYSMSCHGKKIRTNCKAKLLWLA